MEELFETLIQACAWQDVVTIEGACDKLGLNYFKILDYSTTDHDAKNALIKDMVNVSRDVLKEE